MSECFLHPLVTTAGEISSVWQEMIQLYLHQEHTQVQFTVINLWTRLLINEIQ